MTSHAVVSSEQWLAARQELLEKEKDFSRLRDELTQQRRDLPWERVEKEYTFDGPDGKETLSDLCGDCSQLLIYHFMYGSINHNASYYTLHDIPRFDEDGLWSYRNICSRRPPTAIAVDPDSGQQSRRAATPLSVSFGTSPSAGGAGLARVAASSGRTDVVNRWHGEPGTPVFFGVQEARSAILLGCWKIPTENADDMVPCLKEIAAAQRLSRSCALPNISFLAFQNTFLIAKSIHSTMKLMCISA